MCGRRHRSVRHDLNRTAAEGTSPGTSSSGRRVRTGDMWLGGARSAAGRQFAECMRDKRGAGALALGPLPAHGRGRPPRDSAARVCSTGASSRFGDLNSPPAPTGTCVDSCRTAATAVHARQRVALSARMCVDSCRTAATAVHARHDHDATRAAGAEVRAPIGLFAQPVHARSRRAWVDPRAGVRAEINARAGAESDSLPWVDPARACGTEIDTPRPADVDGPRSNHVDASVLTLAETAAQLLIQVAVSALRGHRPDRAPDETTVSATGFGSNLRVRFGVLEEHHVDSLWSVWCRAAGVHRDAPGRSGPRPPSRLAV